MVETITPVVHGGRSSRWRGAVALHAVGATVAAATLGLALGAAGWLLGAPWGTGGLVLVASVAALYALRELAHVPVPIPDRRRQVPEWWRTFFSPRVAPMLYGLGLGIGFLTYLRHGTLVAVAAVAVASGHPLMGAALMVPFGLARGLSVAVARGATSSEGVARVVDRLERLAGAAGPRVANGLVLIALAASVGTAGGAAAGPAGSGYAVPILGVVFAWGMAAKLIRFRQWRSALEAYRLGPVVGPVAVAVPVAEAAVPALAVAGAGRASAAVALGLLVAFTGALLRVSGGTVACGCFGGRKRRPVRLLLVRNAVLAGIGALAIAAPGEVLRLRAPSGQDLLPALLAVAGGVAILVALGTLIRVPERISRP